jgi:HK97 family phage portal protein
MRIPFFGRERGAVPASAPAVEAKASRTAALIAFETHGRAAWTPRDYAALAREGFARNAVVYRSVRMIAEASASVPWLLYDGEAEVDRHPLLALLAQPNRRQSGVAFREALVGHLMVSGNAYVEAVEIDGAVRELHALRPDRMKVVPGSDGWPSAYEYTVGGRTVRFADPGEGGPAPILHLSFFHPLNDHYGFAPIEAAATALDIHNAAGAWNKALLDNSARPSGALVYQAKEGGNLSQDQFERLKAELETSFIGAAHAGRPLLLEGGLDWKALSLSPKDMDFMAAKDGAAREIALAFGVPPMLLGIPGDNTYSNYQEANRAFWRQTVLPLCGRLAEAIGGWLAPAFGEGDGRGLRLWYDADQVEALSSEREALWARVGAAAFLSVNEKRAAVGYGPVEGGEGVGPDGVKYNFDPGQLRMPRGDPYGGRWTRVGGGAEDDGRLDQGGESTNTLRGGEGSDVLNRHTIRNHVGKTDDELAARIRREQFRGLFYSYGLDRNGTFDSAEAARNFIQRTLEHNIQVVEAVTRGEVREAFLTLRFGYRTGREAFLETPDSEVRIRPTYMVGVQIEHDPTSSQGYRIVTAYPRNFNPRIGR